MGREDWCLASEQVNAGQLQLPARRVNQPAFHRAYGPCAGRGLGSPLFFLNETATTQIYTLSLHDALPILGTRSDCHSCPSERLKLVKMGRPDACQDRKSTRLNSSHGSISYAVFCLKK